MNNTANVTTPAGIMIYPYLFEPNTPVKLKDGRMAGSGKYECQIITDPDTEDFERFVAAIGRNIGAEPKIAERMIREAAPRVGERFPVFDPDHIILRPKTKFGPVKVFDRKGRAVQAEEVYSGNIARALVRPFVFTNSNSGKKAVALRLQAVLIVAPGDPVVPKGGAVDAKALFGDLIEDDGAGEDDIPF